MEFVVYFFHAEISLSLRHQYEMMLLFAKINSSPKILTSIRNAPITSLTANMTTSTEPNQEKTSKTPVEKPNLRKASPGFGNKKYLVGACLLMVVYMYPMIFKPLFGIGEEGELENKDVDESIS